MGDTKGNGGQNTAVVEQYSEYKKLYDNENRNSNSIFYKFGGAFGAMDKTINSINEITAALLGVTKLKDRRSIINFICEVIKQDNGIKPIQLLNSMTQMKSEKYANKPDFGKFSKLSKKRSGDWTDYGTLGSHNLKTAQHGLLANHFKGTTNKTAYGGLAKWFKKPRAVMRDMQTKEPYAPTFDAWARNPHKYDITGFDDGSNLNAPPELWTILRYWNALFVGSNYEIPYEDGNGRVLSLTRVLPKAAEAIEKLYESNDVGQLDDDAFALVEKLKDLLI